MTTLGFKKDISLVANNFGFLRLPLHFLPAESEADWVITGVPFDSATSGRAGTRLGAEAIRRASINLAWEDCRFPWSFDVRQKLKIVDCGDLIYSYGDNQDFVEQLELHATSLLKAGKKMLTLGGDHFITLPLLRAHSKHFGQLAMIHFDAHTDTYENGSNFDHGTMFSRAPKEGLISAKNSVQIGIRTEYDKTLPYTVIDAPTVNEQSIAMTVTQIKQVIGYLPVYLTFDIDCLDPAYAPGTGTPVCGGMTTDRVLKILRELKTINIVGMDIVEVSPAFDQSDITALAGATIALEMLYLQGAKK